MKKILYLRTDICDKELIAGGSVTHTLGVINGFLAHNYEIICASSCMEKLLKLQKLHDFHQLNNPRFLSFLRWKLNCLISNIFFTLQIFRFSKKHSIDFMYQRYSILNCTGVLISKIRNITLILEYNGSEVWVNKYWDKNHGLKLIWLINWIEKINIKHAHYIIVVSQTLKKELIDRGIEPEKILVNPNGVDSNVYDPENLKQERNSIRKKLALENKFVFGFIGTFSQWHGINILEQMIPEIIKRKPRVHFLLIGDGPLCQSIKKTLKCKKSVNSVTFTGILPSEKAREHLAACDAFLCPTQPNPDGSPFFGSPTKLFEYMSLAKPTIASDLDQLAEIIKPAIRLDDETFSKHALGFLVPPKKPESFIRAACQLIDFDMQKFGINARNTIIKEHSWLRQDSKIISFIKKKEVYE